MNTTTDNVTKILSEMRYAGIGSRKVKSPKISNTIVEVAKRLGVSGWTLCSGAADGSDTLFEDGAAFARSSREIYIPWDGFSGRHEPNAIIANTDLEVQEIARRYHPVWDKLTPAAKKLMCRNVNIILGQDLNNPVKFVVAYTDKGVVEGGTGHAIRVAEAYKIPVINIDDPFMRNFDNLMQELFIVRRPFEVELAKARSEVEVQEFIERQKAMREELKTYA